MLNIIFSIMTLLSHLSIFLKRFRVSWHENLFFFFLNSNKNCSVGTNNEGRSGLFLPAECSEMVSESVNEAKNCLKHKDIVRVTAVGRLGIVATNAVLWNRSDKKKRRALIQ